MAQSYQLNHDGIMPIKNYTTIVPANRSIQQIQEMLVKHGASGVLMEYEQGTGRIMALKFLLRIKDNQIPFALPVEWKKFQAVLKSQRVRRWDDEEFVYKVAWRNIRDWVDVQMALYETQMVQIEQIFLPYAVGKDGQTFYQKVLNSNLLLPE